MKYIDYSRHQWEEGDIAFLKPVDEFSSEQCDELLAARPHRPRGYLHPRAAGHPVIILSRLSPASTHVAITPVSAYSSGPDNNYLPPWQQRCHDRKQPGDFRSFVGSALAPGKSPDSALRLRDNKTMPKPKASWVYVQSVWVVPLTVLKGFTKSRQGLLRVEPESLASLRRHMAVANKNVAQVKRDLLGLEPKPKTKPALVPVQAKPSPSSPSPLVVVATPTPSSSLPVVASPSSSSSSLSSSSSSSTATTKSWAAIACAHTSSSSSSSGPTTTTTMSTPPPPPPPTNKSCLRPRRAAIPAIPKGKLIVT